MGPLHSLLTAAMSYLDGLRVEFTVDGSSTRWLALFEGRQGNNLDMGGFTQDFSGEIRVRPAVLAQMKSAGLALKEGVRITVFLPTGALRQFQIRDIDPQPAMWIFSLASPNQ
jgi:hypothetical protein